jgi:starch phosphorylase
LPLEARIAYFSMEIALDPAMPTYSGGLGVLAGDTIRSCADLRVPMVAVTLAHRSGYFQQRLDSRGRQSEKPERWRIADFLEPLDPRVSIEIESRPVALRAWRYWVGGENGTGVPTYLLDADLEENAPEDRKLTDQLYAGDERHRLRQEAVLGIGGIRMLRALGHTEIQRFHLNEGHAALAVLALLEERAEVPPRGSAALEACVSQVQDSCVFTTHTPVPAGHDRFPEPLAREVLGETRMRWLGRLGQRKVLNMTDLALRASHFVNGVAMRHGEISRDMFPRYPIRSITNGIHPGTWAAPAFRSLFDQHIPDWRLDPLSLRYAVGIPLNEIGAAHSRTKRTLVERVNRDAGMNFEIDVLTIGFARRATAYKRATLVFSDLDRLASIAEETGPLQLVFAGKAHPRDAEGKAIIRRVFEASRLLRDRVAVAYLPNYDMELGGLLTAGSDLWLNTPIPPLEASGTSGMKAALNGVPSLSLLDGWWIEGCIEGVTGWAIGSDGDQSRSSPKERDHRHADALYEKLRSVVIPCFYDRQDRYLEVMRHAIALNASFFNTQRMVIQYLYGAYMGSVHLSD